MSDTKQLAFTAEQIDAILAAAQMHSNRNLLDNWDFRNPVNQRGQTSYTTAGYAIDRFQKMTNVGSVTVAISGLVITGCGTGANLSQTIENPELFAGKTVTLSVRGNRTGNSFCITERINNSYALSQNLIIPNTFGIASIMFTLPQTLTDFAIQFADFDASDTATIQSVKLELGTVSTLANDPPVDYGDELRKCQRYYCKAPDGFAKFGLMRSGASASSIEIDFPVIMRTTPVVTVASNIQPSISYQNSSGFSATTGIVDWFINGYTAIADL